MYRFTVRPSDNYSMRIAFLSHQWPGARMGGIGAYVRNAAAALAIYGHDVHVFTLNLPADARGNAPASVTVHETPDLATSVANGTLPAPLAATINAAGDGIYRLAIAQVLTDAFLREHAQQPFDIVEVPEVESLGLPLLLNRTTTVPVVTHLHCATAIAYAGNSITLGESERLIIALEFAAIHLSDAVCAPTRRVVELTREHMGASITADIIPHALATTHSVFTSPPPDGPVLFVGRLERLKGCEVLAKALKQFLTDNPTATFRFAAPDTNTGPGGRSMRAFIESTIGPALAQRVAFLGEVSRSTVDVELAAASFCVMPSLWENFSMALCEAMAAGRAVIVGGGTGSVEIVQDPTLIAERGSAGDLARHMTRLWRNRDERVTCSRAAYDRVRDLCDPVNVSVQRVGFYRRTIDRFNTSGLPDRAARLATLPSSCAAALLPALSSLTAAACGFADPTARTPGTRLLNIMQDVQSKTHRPARVTLYGAGKHTAKLLTERHLWESQGHTISDVIDDHPRFSADPTFQGLPVRSIAASVGSARSGVVHPPIVLSTDTYEDQFWQQTAPLRELGIAVHRLYSKGHPS